MFLFVRIVYFVKILVCDALAQLDRQIRTIKLLLLIINLPQKTQEAVLDVAITVTK